MWLLAGKPEPLGPSKTAGGVNFAIFSRHCKAVTLCLFDEQANLLRELPLDAGRHRTGRGRGKGWLPGAGGGAGLWEGFCGRGGCCQPAGLA